MSDIAEFHRHLRATTAALLGYGDIDHLTTAQQIRLDRAIALRLVIDDAQARQMRGEQINVHEFVDASESLERMAGGQPDAPNEARRFGPDHKARLRDLIERALRAGDVDAAEHDRDIQAREEMAAVIAAGGSVEAVTPPPPPEPQRAANVVPFDANSVKPPPHYLKDTQPREA